MMPPFPFGYYFAGSTLEARVSQIVLALIFLVIAGKVVHSLLVL